MFSIAEKSNTFRFIYAELDFKSLAFCAYNLLREMTQGALALAALSASKQASNYFSSPFLALTIQNASVLSFERTDAFLFSTVPAKAAVS